MTEDEQRQIDALLNQAQERMRRKKYAYEEHQYLFLGCQCKCHEGLMQEKRERQKKDDFETDFQQMLSQICNFCKKHQRCFQCRKDEEGGEEEEELPF